MTAPIVQIPARYGGPAGVFIDAFRGYNRYPVSLQELSSSGRVLSTVGLRRLRCEKEPAGEEPGPHSLQLATLTTPYGEPLTIAAILHQFHGQTEFFLTSQIGIRHSHASEEHGKTNRFQWQLSTECAPRSYTLLDGILLPPGTSVLVRTQAGVTALTKVELALTTHTKGPLFYGVYTTPPTEIVVENADGTILYTESLAAKATEETEFCEGYAEP